MFSKETYINRRNALKHSVGSGILLFLGNDESGMNYEDNTYPYRQDSSFLYFFGLSYAGLAAVIDIDENREIIFGDELSIDHIVWMGTQPTLHEKAQRVGIDSTQPAADLKAYLEKAIAKGQTIHYLPTYRAEHRLKLFHLLNIKPGEEQPSISFIKGVVNLRNYKTDEEITEIERACDVTAEMHLAAMRCLRIGMKEHEVSAALEAVAQANGCTLSFPTIATVCGQTLHNHYHGHTVKEGDMLLVDAGAETPMGYAGDMSSTICAGKKFSTRQKKSTIYRLLRI